MNHKKRTILYMMVSLLLIGLAACGSVEVGTANTASEPQDMPNNQATDLTKIEVGIEPTPTPSAQTYVNDFYGFKFEYPETFQLEEIDHGVILESGTVSLRINFKFANETFMPERSGMGAGEFIYENKANFMGLAVPADALLYEMKIKAVFFNQGGEIAVDNLIFYITLEDLETDYMAVDIPEEIRTQAIEILESFERIEATGTLQDTASSAAGQSDPFLQAMQVDGWLFYQNQDVGFGISYPEDMSVVEEPNQLEIKKGTLTLLINYRSDTEPEPFLGAGQLEGDFEPVGHVSLLGEQVPIFINTLSGFLKGAFFGPPGEEIGDQTNLRFSIILLNTAGDELTMDEIALFTQIVGTLGLTE